jgi:DME family drug/metabolite transporter
VWNDPAVPVLLVLLASALFGTTGTARALGLPDLDPIVTGALRIAVGGLLLAVVALARRRPRLVLPPRDSSARVALLLVAAGTAGVVVYQPTFFAGVRANGVAVGTLVALGSAPILTGLAGWALSRRRPDARWFGCTLLAVAGVALLSGLLDGGAARSLGAAGLLASLAAGAGYAAYTLAVKGLLDLGWPTVAAVGSVFGIAGVVGVVELLATGTWPSSGLEWLAAAWLGVLTITAAYLLFTRGLERLPAATVATLTLAEPVVAAVLGVLLLGERMTATGLLGGVLLLLALGLLGLPRAWRMRPVPAPVEAPGAGG